MITITEGLIPYKHVKVHVVVRIREEFHCPDIYVDHDLKESVCREPYESDLFKSAVIQLLIEQGKLDAGEYTLERAELGMQSDNICVFECLFKNGKDVTEEFSEKFGAISLEKIEKAKRDKERDEVFATHDKETIVEYVFKHIKCKKNILLSLAHDRLLDQCSPYLVRIITSLILHNTEDAIISEMADHAKLELFRMNEKQLFYFLTNRDNIKVLRDKFPSVTWVE